MSDATLTHRHADELDAAVESLDEVPDARVRIAGAALHLARLAHDTDVPVGFAQDALLTAWYAIRSDAEDGLAPAQSALDALDSEDLPW